jgi:hypothetical protein
VYHDYDEVVVNEMKLKHLELGRYIILKKYLDLNSAVRLLPSLVMAEILTCGFAVTMGKKALRSKLEAVKLGAQTDVESVDTDTWRLIHRLETEIPVGQLGDSKTAKVLHQAANVVFRSNVAVNDYIDRLK